MADFATLSIKVDSSGVKTATTEVAALGKQAETTSRQVDSIGNSGDKIASIFKGLATVFALKELGSAIKDLTLLAARYETLGISMNVVGLNAGYGSTQMAEFQRGLEKTGISAIESRNNLARMAAAQLDLTKSGKLARVAQDAAVIGDINSSEAFERLVQGIVTGQPRILHTMGIFADFEGAEKKWAHAHGKTMETLSQAEKVQIRFNATLEEGAKRAGVYEAAMGTAGKQIKSMERYVQDLQVQIGNTMMEALTASVARLVTGLKDSKTAMDDWAASGGQGVFAMNLRDGVMSLVDALVTAGKWIYDHTESISLMAAAYVSLKIGDVVTAMFLWGKSIYDSTSALIVKITTLEATRAETVRSMLAEAGLATQVGGTARAHIASATAMIASRAASIAAAVASGTMTVAEGILAKAELAVAAAAVTKAEAVVAGTVAMEGAQIAMAQMTGGISLLVTLLGTAAASWFIYGNAQNKVAKSTADGQKWLAEENQKVRDKMESDAKITANINSGMTPTEAAEKEWDPTKNDRVAMAQKLYGDAQIAEAKAVADLASARADANRFEGAGMAELKAITDAQLGLQSASQELYRAKQAWDTTVELTKGGHQSTLDLEALKLAKMPKPTDTTPGDGKDKQREHFLEGLKRDTSAVNAEIAAGFQINKDMESMEKERAKILAAAAVLGLAEEDKVTHKITTNNAVILKRLAAVNALHGFKANDKVFQDAVGPDVEMQKLLDTGKSIEAMFQAGTITADQNTVALERNRLAIQALNDSRDVRMKALINPNGKAQRDYNENQMAYSGWTDGAGVEHGGYKGTLQPEVRAQIERALAAQQAAVRISSVSPTVSAALPNLKPYLGLEEELRVLLEAQQMLKEGGEDAFGLQEASAYTYEETLKSLNDAISANYSKTMALKAAQGNTWALMSQVIDKSAGSAADALVNWMDKTDGLARTWESLGTTVRNVVADMLKQMARAIIQAQLMQPAMDWAKKGSNWGDLWAAGLSLFGSTTPGTAVKPIANGGSSSGLAYSGALPAANGSGIEGSVTINITNTSSGAGEPTVSTTPNLAALGKMIAAQTRQTIVDESRHGGLLARA